MEKINIDGLEAYVYGDVERVLKKQTNIWLGVSIAMKPYSEDLVRKYLEFMLKYSKDMSRVVIGDDIAAVSMQELDGMDELKAMDRAGIMGDIWEERYLRVIQSLGSGDVGILRFAELYDEMYWKRFAELGRVYNENEEFKGRVQGVIREYLISRGRTVTDERLDLFGRSYILAELPTMLSPLEIRGEQLAETMLYPTYNPRTSLASLLEGIMEGNDYGIDGSLFDFEKMTYVDVSICGER